MEGYIQIGLASTPQMCSNTDAVKADCSGSHSSLDVHRLPPRVSYLVDATLVCLLALPCSPVIRTK